MSIKERPLLKAVDRLGPLPGFLFENMFWTGFFALIMCPVFGAVFVIFWTAGHGGVEAIIIFQAGQLGAIGGLVIGGVTLLLIAGSAVMEPEERKGRMRFVYGGCTAILLFLVLDILSYPYLARYFEQAGPIV